MDKGDTMMQAFKRVTQEEIEEVWGNADFGPVLNNCKMEFVKNSLLKWAIGYSTGSTIFSILVKLDLMTKKERLTRRGKFQLWDFYGKELI